jgi:hypothetical protein
MEANRCNAKLLVFVVLYLSDNRMLEAWKHKYNYLLEEDGVALRETRGYP